MAVENAHVALGTVSPALGASGVSSSTADTLRGAVGLLSAIVLCRHRKH